MDGFKAGDRVEIEDSGKFGEIIMPLVGIWYAVRRDDGSEQDYPVHLLKHAESPTASGKVSVHEGDGLLFVNGRLIAQFGRGNEATAYGAAPADLRTLLTTLTAVERERDALRAALETIRTLSLERETKWIAHEFAKDHSERQPLIHIQWGQVASMANDALKGAGG